MPPDCKKLIAQSDSESEPEIYINKEYAENYENWRKKEEYQKLKSKYGENVLSESSEFSGSDSGTDSDQDLLEEELNKEVFDEDFLRVYGALKSNDPRIYDEKFTFVKKCGEETPTSQAGEKSKREKGKKMHLVDYHVKLMKERDGITEEDNEEAAIEEISNDPGYYGQLGKIKEDFKKIIENGESDDDDDMFKTIGGQKIADKPIESKSSNPLENTDDVDIAYLNSYWNREDVDESERFIRDFILKKKYLDKKLKIVSSGDRVVGSSKDDTAFFFGNMPADDESQEDEKTEESKAVPIDGTAKYRFQERGATEIKRYPRVIDSARDLSSRDERATKRKEKRELKKKEKEEDLMRFTQLRREQERERIRKLIEASKNKKIDESDPTLEKLVDEVHEFDPEQYDNMMKQLYDNDYYQQGEQEDEKKPTFEFIPGLDDASEESENESEAEAEGEVDQEINPGDSDLDDDEELKDLNCRKRRRVRKKKLRERLRKAKDLDSLPDYEDVIGKDLPVKFKYRQVIPNDFGLSIEEILLADDKDLNRWASLKTTVAFRDEDEEQRDLKRFNSKRNDLKHKQKILKSLFAEEGASETGKKKKKRRGKKKISATAVTAQVDDSDSDETGRQERVEQEDEESQDESQPPAQVPEETKQTKVSNGKKKSRKRQRRVVGKTQVVDEDRLKAYGFSKRAMKRKKLL